MRRKATASCDVPWSCAAASCLVIFSYAAMSREVPARLGLPLGRASYCTARFCRLVPRRTVLSGSYVLRGPVKSRRLARQCPDQTRLAARSCLVKVWSCRFVTSCLVPFRYAASFCHVRCCHVPPLSMVRHRQVMPLRRVLSSFAAGRCSVRHSFAASYRLVTFSAGLPLCAVLLCPAAPYCFVPFRLAALCSTEPSGLAAGYSVVPSGSVEPLRNAWSSLAASLGMVWLGCAATFCTV